MSDHTDVDPVHHLIPYPRSVVVSVHPDRDGDITSEAFIDTTTGERFIIFRDPETALSVGEHLVHAVTDDEIADQADRLRGH